jgi:cellulase
MKTSAIAALAFGLLADAHTIFQKVSVNGNDQGSLVGLRAPSNNNPVQDAKSTSLVCGTSGSKSGVVISAAAGDRIGAWYQHVIGGAQGGNDADNPIAASHKGPVVAYLAKVDSAVNADPTKAAWFKIWEDTFNPSTTKWGVDNLISNNGWAYFNLPSCIPAGQYLLRVEITALHSAYSQGGVQFYSSCAQLNISGGGSKSPSSTVSFPGAYQPNQASIQINIYGTGGKADNGGKPYPQHGPAVFTC